MAGNKLRKYNLLKFNENRKKCPCFTQKIDDKYLRAYHDTPENSYGSSGVVEICTATDKACYFKTCPFIFWIDVMADELEFGRVVLVFG